ncbi:MAG: ABC transporter permease [Candidatus Aquicultor sp.]
MSFTIRLAFKYLWARKMRSFLTTLAIIFGVMIIFGLNGMLPAIMKSFEQNIAASSGQVDLSVISETQGVFDGNVVSKVRGVSGIAHATPLLVRPIIVPSADAPKNKDGQPVSSFRLTGIDPKTVADVHPLRVTKGRALSPADKNSMLVTTNLADTTGLKVGDTLILPSGTGETKFSIVGLVEEPPTPGSENLYMPLKTAQAVLNQTGKINTLEAQFSSGVNREEVRKAVLAALDSGFELGGAESGSQYLASIQLA